MCLCVPSQLPWNSAASKLQILYKSSFYHVFNRRCWIDHCFCSTFLTHPPTMQLSIDTSSGLPGIFTVAPRGVSVVQAMRDASPANSPLKRMLVFENPKSHPH